MSKKSGDIRALFRKSAAAAAAAAAEASSNNSNSGGGGSSSNTTSGAGAPPGQHDNKGGATSNNNNATAADHKPSSNDIRSHFSTGKSKKKPANIGYVDPKKVAESLSADIVLSNSDAENNKSIDWEEIILLTRQKPRFVQDHPVMLHQCIARKAPMDVIKAFVKAVPTILIEELTVDYRGCNQPFCDCGYNVYGTPLSLACTLSVDAPLEIIRFLIKEMVRHRSMSSYVRQFRNYESEWCMGLFETVSFDTISLEKLKVLLEEHPNGAAHLASSDTDYAYGALSAEYAFTNSIEEGNANAFEKLKFLLMAGAKGTTDEQRIQTEGGKFLLSHAFLEAITYHGRFANARRFNGREHMRFDEEEILKVLTYFQVAVPEQFLEVDEHGNLPLHYALSNKQFADWFRCEDESDAYKFNLDHRKSSAKIIQYLLKIHPESITIRDGKGRLPLHIALESLVPCYKLVVDASPAWCFESKCPVTRLFPFQIAPASAQRLCANYKTNKEWFERARMQEYGTEAALMILQKAPALALIGLTAQRESWYDSDVFTKLQKKKMERTSLDAEIMHLERKVEDMKKREAEDNTGTTSVNKKQKSDE